MGVVGAVGGGVNNPRFSGSMTHQAHSFKHNNNGNSQAGTDNNTVGSRNDSKNRNNGNNFSVHHKVNQQSEVGVMSLLSMEGSSQGKGFFLRKPNIGSMAMTTMKATKV